MRNKSIAAILAVFLLTSGCLTTGEKKPRLCMFIGVDISGSFAKSSYFEDSLDFLAHYIYSHLNGLGELERPQTLFVSSIGGASADEPKTLYTIQTIQNKSVEAIQARMTEIFPRQKVNRFTDYNAFLEQVALHFKNQTLLLRPISIVMLSDGIPDISNKDASPFESLAVKPLETLSRNVTLRLLYTDAVVATRWQTEVKRKRVKVWTQDAEVMLTWKDPDIFLPETPLKSQERFFSWLKDNVNFGVRARVVN